MISIRRFIFPELRSSAGLGGVGPAGIRYRFSDARWIRSSILPFWARYVDNPGMDGIPKAVWTDGTPVTWEDIASQIHATSGQDKAFASASPNGSDRVDDAVSFMKFILSDNEQVEGYAKLLNLTTRSDMADNKYFQAEPLVQDVAKALAVGRTPYTLTFFEQINSPQGPWLQMLQRAYYKDDAIATVIADAKDAMKKISCQQ